MKTTHLRWFGFLSILSLAFALALFGAGPAAQGKAPAVTAKTKTVSSTAQRGSGTDAHVKSNSPVNPASKRSAPAGSKGTATKGFGPYPCTVHIDNRTQWYVQVYVDGFYYGLVPPLGDMYVRRGNGTTTWYSVAVFDDGSREFWPEQTFQCPAYSSFTWRVWP